MSVFKQYCEFYTDYRLDKETSVEERFRTGECPLIIADYTLYNNLQVSAPDILGLWDFTTRTRYRAGGRGDQLRRQLRGAG